MRRATTEQYKTIRKAKKDLLEYLDGEFLNVDPVSAIRNTVMAYVTPELEHSNGGEPFYESLNIVRRPARIELEHTWGTVLISHVIKTDFQPVSVPAVAEMEHNVQSDDDLRFISESVMLEYNHGSKVAFAILSDDHDPSISNRQRMCEKLLQLPDMPVYLDLK